MLKSLFRDSVIYGLANAAQKLVPFVVIPLITAYLGQEALKQYDVAFVYAYLFSWLIILGQDAAASILYFDEKSQAFNKKTVLGYSLLIQFSLLLIAVLLLWPFNVKIGNALFEGDQSMVSFWSLALWIVPGHLILNYALNVLLWQKRRSTYVLLCCLQTLLSIVAVYIVVVMMSGSLRDLFFALIAVTSFCAVLALFNIRDAMQFSLVTFDKTLFYKLLLLGLPFGLTSFFHQLLPSIDRYSLLEFGYQAQMGVYALGVKLGAFIGLGVNAFALAFTPYSLQKINKHDAETEISGLFRLIAVAAFLLVPFLLFFKDLMIRFFADNSYAAAAGLLPFFFMGWVFDLFTYFSLLGVYKSQNTTIILFLFFIATIIVSILNIALVPVYGLAGAAASFCISKAALFFISLAVLKKYFRLVIHYQSFLIALIASAGCIYMIYEFDIVVSLPVYLAICLCAVLYFIRQKNFKYIFKPTI